MDSKLKDFKILIVEDERLMQQLVHDVLLKLGFHNIFKAKSGNEALDTLEQEGIDFIICDWRMPDMDGIAFTKAVRASLGAHALVPIVMLTGNAEKHHVTLARDVGVNEYLIKPFTVKDLCSRLKEIIERPREFVVAPSYKGPSRRRKVSTMAPVADRRRRYIKPIARK